MRYRYGNHFRDAHSKDMHIYDMVLPDADVNMHDLVLAIEHAIPNLVLFPEEEPIEREEPLELGFVGIRKRNILEPHEGRRGDPSKYGWQNGTFWFSIRPDNSLYIAFSAYDYECNDRNCPARHINEWTGKGPTIKKGPKIDNGDINKVKSLIGEHGKYKLTDGEAAHPHLASLGFTPVDAPLRDEVVAVEHVHTALNVLAEYDEELCKFKSACLITGYHERIQLPRLSRKANTIYLNVLREMIS